MTDTRPAQYGDYQVGDRVSVQINADGWSRGWVIDSIYTTGTVRRFTVERNGAFIDDVPVDHLVYVGPSPTVGRNHRPSTSGIVGRHRTSEAVQPRTFRVSVVAGADTDAFQTVVPLTDARHHPLSEYAIAALIDVDAQDTLLSVIGRTELDRAAEDAERLDQQWAVQLGTVPCERCGEPGTEDNPLGEFWHSGRPWGYHAQCAADAGLNLS